MEIGINSAIQEIEKAIEKAMDRIQPIATKEIKREISTIATHARNNWPIRQGKYGESQGSRNRIKISLKKEGMTSVGSISNDAPYAWAIKAGKESNTNVSPGKGIADTLIYQPARKASNKIGKQIAGEILDTIRRG